MSTNATTEPTENSTDRITIDVGWADWEGTRPSTSDPEILSEVIEAEVKALVSEGAYPAGTRFEELLEPGEPGTFEHPIIDISVSSLESLFDFYTAYCGGDSMQAVEELDEIYGYTAPEGWTPKG